MISAVKSSRAASMESHDAPFASRTKTSPDFLIQTSLPGKRKFLGRPLVRSANLNTSPSRQLSTNLMWSQRFAVRSRIPLCCAVAWPRSCSASKGGPSAVIKVSDGLIPLGISDPPEFLSAAAGSPRSNRSGLLPNAQHLIDPPCHLSQQRPADEANPSGSRTIDRGDLRRANHGRRGKASCRQVLDREVIGPPAVGSAGDHHGPQQPMLTLERFARHNERGTRTPARTIGVGKRHFDDIAAAKGRHMRGRRRRIAIHRRWRMDHPQAYPASAATE